MPTNIPLEVVFKNIGKERVRLLNEFGTRPLQVFFGFRIAEFEKELDLAREAVELGLIYDPYLYAEVLC